MESWVWLFHKLFGWRSKLCECGHGTSAHEHYLKVHDKRCSLCPCQRFNRRWKRVYGV